MYNSGRTEFNFRVDEKIGSCQDSQARRVVVAGRNSLSIRDKDLSLCNYAAAVCEPDEAFYQIFNFISLVAKRPERESELSHMS